MDVMTMASTSHPVADRDTPVPDGGSRRTATAELVAGIVNGVPSIGEACALLRKAGWHATIAANRVTVDDDVFAQFIVAPTGPHGRSEARWVIYRIAGASPVWIVGTQRPPARESDPESVSDRESRRAQFAQQGARGTAYSRASFGFDGYPQPGMGVGQ